MGKQHDHKNKIHIKYTHNTNLTHAIVMENQKEFFIHSHLQNISLYLCLYLMLRYVSHYRTNDRDATKLHRNFCSNPLRCIFKKKNIVCVIKFYVSGCCCII